MAPLSDNALLVWLVALVLAMFVLFAGDPDWHDAIMSRIAGNCAFQSAQVEDAP